MEVEANAANAAAVASPADGDGGVSGDGAVFGTRPNSDRPHSINLSGASRAQPLRQASRAMDVLLGLGIGAAIMYYLDPDAGAERRARVRERLVGG